MSDRTLSADRPLPEGVRDLLFADAAAFRAMTAALQTTWAGWGYREISLPTFEYADTLATDVGAAVDAEMYRFFCAWPTPAASSATSRRGPAAKPIALPSNE
jgi:hypothetical protein